MESVKGPPGVSPNLESSLGQLSKFGELIGTALQISLETPLGCPSGGLLGALFGGEGSSDGI